MSIYAATLTEAEKKQQMRPSVLLENGNHSLVAEAVAATRIASTANRDEQAGKIRRALKNSSSKLYAARATRVASLSEGYYSSDSGNPVAKNSHFVFARKLIRPCSERPSHLAHVPVPIVDSRDAAIGMAKHAFDELVSSSPSASANLVATVRRSKCDVRCFKSGAPLLAMICKRSDFRRVEVLSGPVDSRAVS